MENEEHGDVKQPSIPGIDEDIARLNGRLRSLLDHIRSAAHGEQPVSTDESAKEAIQSASLESISQRLRDAHDTVSKLETFMKRFHS